jgi:hypothetical protein
MKNKFLPIMDKLLLHKRSLIETVNDQLKNISQIEHSRPRSVANFLVNLVAGLIAYTYQPKKPSLHVRMPHPESLPLVVLCYVELRSIGKAQGSPDLICIPVDMLFILQILNGYKVSAPDCLELTNKLICDVSRPY